MIPKVYFIKSAVEDGEEVISAKAARIFKEGGFAKCFKPDDFTAVKIHTGEKGNKTYIKAPCLKGLVDELIKIKTKPFLTDTSTGSMWQDSAYRLSRLTAFSGRAKPQSKSTAS